MFVSTYTLMMSLRKSICKIFVFINPQIHVHILFLHKMVIIHNNNDPLEV